MHQNLINKLKFHVQDALLPILKGKKCVLLDVPYYGNIGDTLIWEGTRCFLKENGIPCKLTASKETFDFPVLDKNIVILLQGGGNFGDIWIQHQIFRAKVIAHYPQNKIVILPQTVYFEHEENMIADAAQLAQHPDLTIIGRDNVSYDLLKKYYSHNNIMKLPDMAFCINRGLKRQTAKTGRMLFFKRTDKEANDAMADRMQEIVPTSAEIHEWPTMEGEFQIPLKWRTLLRLSYRLHWSEDTRWNKVLRPLFVETGVNFINQYDKVFTTRLHGCILSILLGKPIIFFDNSYGKNSSFYDTWLQNDKDIKFIR